MHCAYNCLFSDKAGNGLEFGMIRQMIRQKPDMRIPLSEIINYLKAQVSLPGDNVEDETSIHQVNGTIGKKKSSVFSKIKKGIFGKKDDKHQIQPRQIDETKSSVQRQQQLNSLKPARPLSSIWEENPSESISTTPMDQGIYRIFVTELFTAQLLNWGLAESVEQAILSSPAHSDGTLEDVFTHQLRNQQETNVMVLEKKESAINRRRYSHSINTSENVLTNGFERRHSISSTISPQKGRDIYHSLY